MMAAKEDPMSHSADEPRNKPASTSYQQGDPEHFAFLDWMREQDPSYAEDFHRYAAHGTGEGGALPAKVREMIMTAILAFTGRQEGAEAHLRRAIELGATRRELFEAGQAAAIPGGGIVLGLWMQVLTRLDRAGAFRDES